MDAASVPGPVSIEGTSSSLTVCTPHALSVDLTAIEPVTTRPDVEAAEHQPQQLASGSGSVVIPILQKPPFSPRVNKDPQQHDNLALLKPTHPCDSAQSTATVEGGISGASGKTTAMQSPASDAGASFIRPVAHTSAFRTIPYVALASSPHGFRDQWDGSHNPNSSEVSSEYYHPRSHYNSSVQVAADQLLPSSATHIDNTTADSRLVMQPLSGESFMHSPIHEEALFNSPIEQQVIPSAMTSCEFALPHSRNPHMSDHERTMSQQPISRQSLDNPPLSNNLAVAEDQICSPSGRGDFPIYHPSNSYGSIHDQDNRFLSIGHWIASQKPGASEKNDSFPDDNIDFNQVKISSPPVQRSNSIMPRGSALAHDQAAQALADQQIMGPRFPWKLVDDSCPPLGFANDQGSELSWRPHYSSVSRFGYTSLLGNTHERLFDQRGANQPLRAERTLSGLPADDSFDTASRRDVWSQDQPATTNRPFGEDRGMLNVQDPSFGDQGYGCQQSGPCRSIDSQQIPEDMTYRNVAQRPIFGFSSVAEAQSFEPLPQKRVWKSENTHRNSAGETDRQSFIEKAATLDHKSEQVSLPFSNGRGSTMASRQFDRPGSAIPLMRPSTQKQHLKQEQDSSSRFQGSKRSNDGQFVSNVAPEFWDKFAMHTVSSSIGLEGLSHAGKQDGSDDQGFVQAVSDDHLIKLESGEILEQGPLNNNGLYYHPGSSGVPTWLREIAVSYLADNEVLFYFNVIAVMAQMSPHFEFKHVDADRNKVTTKLTIWKHVAVAEATSSSVRAAEILACRQALEKMQENNSDWVIPPLPMDGPTGPKWVWTKLLKDFCTEQCLTRPRYRSTKEAGYLHCSIAMDTRRFHGERKCTTIAGAENTAAHMALYKLTIMGIDNPARRPVMSPNHDPKDVAVPAWGSLGKSMESRFNTLRSPNNGLPNDTSSKYRLPANTLPRKRPWNKDLSKKGPNDAPRKQLDHKFQYAGVSKPFVRPKKKSPAFYFNRARWAKRRKIEAIEAQMQQLENGRRILQNDLSSLPGFAHAANRVPLSSCRLSPIEYLEDSVDDLAIVRTLDSKFALLNTLSSFRKILETICETMQVDYPEIARGDRSKDSTFPHAREMLAIFTKDPYLCRASPIRLVDVNHPDRGVAQEIGIKSVILYLLKIIKEDAHLDQKMYGTEWPNIKRIEDETTKCLLAQNEPATALPY